MVSPWSSKRTGICRTVQPRRNLERREGFGTWDGDKAVRAGGTSGRKPHPTPPGPSPIVADAARVPGSFPIDTHTEESFDCVRLQWPRRCRREDGESAVFADVVCRGGLGWPPALESLGKNAVLLRLTVGVLAALTLAACTHRTPGQMPAPSIGAGNPYPESNYTCDGTRLAVRLMGDKASVSVNGAAAVDLPAVGSRGRHTPTDARRWSSSRAACPGRWGARCRPHAPAADGARRRRNEA